MRECFLTISSIHSKSRSLPSTRSVYGLLIKMRQMSSILSRALKAVPPQLSVKEQQC